METTMIITVVILGMSAVTWKRGRHDAALMLAVLASMAR